MVRYASGAFVTSPVLSVMSEAGTLPFHLLVLQSVTQVAIRILEKNEAAGDLPIIQRVFSRLEEVMNISSPNISIRTRLTDRIWHKPKPQVVWTVKQLATLRKWYAPSLMNSYQVNSTDILLSIQTDQKATVLSEQECLAKIFPGLLAFLHNAVSFQQKRSQ